MSNALAFTVYGCPIAQPRIKAQAVMSKGGRMFAHVYEPGKKDSPARIWKSDVKTSALAALNGLELQEGPLRIDINVYFPRPQRLMRAKDPDFAIWHTSKPDRDNIDKGILDALKGIVFVDDAQVCMGEIRKYYHEKGGRPRAEIRILVLE
jgi:Holliday junction resolvase RusA-like endonuclease